MAVLVDGTPFTIEFLLDKISPDENFPHFKDLESFEVKVVNHLVNAIFVHSFTDLTISEHYRVRVYVFDL